MPENRDEEFRPITAVRARDQWGRFTHPSAENAADFEFMYADSVDSYDPDESEWESEEE